MLKNCTIAGGTSLMRRRRLDAGRLLTGLAMAAYATCAISAPKTNVIPYAQEPYPAANDPANALEFRMGHDFGAIRNALLDLPVRGEFEKSDAYESRLKHAIGGKIYGDVRAIDWLARSGALSSDKGLGNGLIYQYDADWETFSLCLSPLLEPGRIEKASALVLKQRLGSYSKSLGTYLGTNSLGVKKKVSKREDYFFSLAIPVPDIMGKHCFAPIKMTPEETKRRLQGAMWLLVGKIRPEVFRTYRHDKPTINDPSDISTSEESLVFAVDRAIAFNPLTGEVWYSGKWDGDAIIPQADD